MKSIWSNLASKYRVSITFNLYDFPFLPDGEWLFEYHPPIPTDTKEVKLDRFPAASKAETASRS